MGKKVLVIGSGPSGIFTCGALSSDKSIDVKVLVTFTTDRLGSKNLVTEKHFLTDRFCLGFESMDKIDQTEREAGPISNWRTGKIMRIKSDL